MKAHFLLLVHGNDPDDVINLVTLHKQAFLDCYGYH